MDESGCLGLRPYKIPHKIISSRCQTITFETAAEMLDTFGMPQGGSQYRRLIDAFKRVFGATIFFGTDTHVTADLK